MDRAPLQQRGQPQPIFPNEMLHEKKMQNKLSTMFIIYTFVLFRLPSDLELAAPAADVVGTRALKAFLTTSTGVRQESILA